MKVGLLGFGRTGRLVASELLQEKNLTLEWVIKKSNEYSGMYASHLIGHEDGRGKVFSIQSLDLDQFFNKHSVDVLIDFSSKQSLHVYNTAAKYGVKIVSAISNYEQNQILELRRLSKHTAILHSPNITLGINILMSISKSLQQIMPHADIEIIEEHFRGKQEVSGTAIRIAKSLGLDETNHVNSIRVGGIVGKHEIIFGLNNQTIRLVHESINRSSFGEGAIYAAKWLKSKKTGFYSMEDILRFNDSEESACHLPPDSGRSYHSLQVL